MAGVVVPTVGVHNASIKFIYGMASLTHGFRLLQLVRPPEQFEGSSWEFRLAFVHCYHDLREAKLVPEDRMTHRVLLLALQLNGSLSVAFVVSKWMALTAPTVVLLFFCSLLIMDAIYRLPLAFNHVEINCTIQQPWNASTLREFWAEAWNVVIQRMLKEGVYEPMRSVGWGRTVAATTTFFFSGIIHTYPLLLMGMETRHAVQMLGFFLLQPALMAFEKATRMSGRFWVLFILLITLPLFAKPLVHIVKAMLGG